MKWMLHNDIILVSFYSHAYVNTRQTWTHGDQTLYIWNGEACE